MDYKLSKYCDARLQRSLQRSLNISWKMQIGVLCIVHACIMVSVSKLRNSSKLLNTASHPVWRCCRARWLGPGSRIYRCRGGGCCGGRCLRSRRTWWSSWCRPCASPTPWSGVSASPVSTWQTVNAMSDTDRAEKDNHFLIQTENVNVNANPHARHSTLPLH